jgi:hypothetical protein
MLLFAVLSGRLKKPINSAVLWAGLFMAVRHGAPETGTKWGLFGGRFFGKERALWR